jgi:thiol-disulfide isomerase/thioredoxin
VSKVHAPKPASQFNDPKTYPCDHCGGTIIIKNNSRWCHDCKLIKPTATPDASKKEDGK